MSCDQWVSKFESQPPHHDQPDDHEVDEDEVDVENNYQYEFAASPLAGQMHYHDDDEEQKLERNLDSKFSKIAYYIQSFSSFFTYRQSILTSIVLRESKSLSYSILIDLMWFQSLSSFRLLLNEQYEG